MKLEHVSYPKYPAMAFLLRWGWYLVVIVAALPLAAAAVAVSAGVSPWALAAGLACSVIVGLLFQAFVELLGIIADFLLPR